MQTDLTTNVLLNDPNLPPLLRSGSKQDFLEETLPQFFGVKAAKHQKSIIRGRHPASLPKDSELWHYSKLSGARHRRIKGGHEFWGVLDDESIDNQSTTDSIISSIESAKPRKHSILDKYRLKGTLQSQLKSAMSQNSKDLNLKVDFQNKQEINYGMTFIIMNYANEIMYIDKNNETRVKSIKDVAPEDRVKFKLVDLIHPNNPSVVRFGDGIWLQALELNDNSDNSFHSGSVLTSKLFSPPELNSVTFDQDTTDGISSPPSPLAGSNISSSENSPDRSSRRQTKTFFSQSPTNKLKKRSTGLNLGVLDPSKKPSYSEKAPNDGDEDDNTDLTSVASSEASTPLGKLGKKISDDRSSIIPPQVEGASKLSKMCGHVHLNRIVEVRRLEGHYFEGMSDEKALRYNSKQSLHLGKYTIHSALPSASSDASGKGTSSNTSNDACLYSLTPIIIQQDQYCLSSVTHSEYTQWPPNSSYIIQHSKTINHELANEYEKNYRKVSNNSNNLNSSSLAAKGKKPSVLQQNNTARSISKNSENSFNTASSVIQDIKSNEGQISSEPPSYFIDDSNTNDHCCIRKVQVRNTPSEFLVDRRCVWKFCLFEQFSEGFLLLQASDKEKEVKKVMETATMVLKLSKLNREGGRVHLKPDGELNTPALLSGESFVRTLREIRFKHTMKIEQEYLVERRKRELKLKDYFTNRMMDIMNEEENNFSTISSPYKPNLSSADSIASYNSSMSSIYGAPKTTMGIYSQFKSNLAKELNPTASIHSLASIESIQSPNDEIDAHSLTYQEKRTASSKSQKRGHLTFGPPPSSGDPENSRHTPHRISSHPNSSHSIHRNNDASSVSSSTGGTIPPPLHYSNTMKARDEFLRFQDTLSNIASTSLFLTTTNHEDVEEKPKLPPLSTDALRVFGDRIGRPSEEVLVLNSVQTLKNYDKLSPGEQILSYHNTMKFLNKGAQERFKIEQQLQNQPIDPTQNPNFLKPKGLNNSILRKIENLEKEDKRIGLVIETKEMLRKRQGSIQLTDENSSGI